MGRRGGGRRWPHRVRLVAVVATCAWFASGCLWMNRVSVTQGGTQTEADSVSVVDDISADGRYVLFESTAASLGGNGAGTQVFRRDNATGEVVMVSVSGGGAPGTQTSFDGRLSSDGRFAVFRSYAPNLVPSDRNGKSDVFLRDLDAGTTELVSVPLYGGQGFADSFGPDVSDDGRYVAFSSGSSNLVPGDTNFESDVFVRDRVEETTVRVSTTEAGGQLNGSSSGASFGPGPNPALAYVTRGAYFDDDIFANSDVILARWPWTDGGDCVTYCGLDVDFGGPVVLDEDNVVYEGADSFGNRQIIRDQRFEGNFGIVPDPVSVTEVGTFGNGDSVGASASADGRYVAFTSLASNLVPGDTNSERDVFVRDVVEDRTRRVSVSESGAQGTPVGAYSEGGVISGDGEFVAFHSTATNFTGAGQAPDTNGVLDVFVRLAQPGPSVTTPNLLAPAEVPPGGSVPVTIEGGHFRSTTTVGATHSGITLSDVVVVDEDTITATMSAAAGVAPGLYALNVFDTRASWNWQTIALTQSAAAVAVGDRVAQLRSNAPLWPWDEAQGRGRYHQFQDAAGSPAYSVPRYVDDLTAPGAPLSAHSCLVLPVNTTPFTPTQLDILQSYVLAGGTLVAIGEQPGFDGGNATMNALSAALGAHLSIATGSGPHDAAGFSSTTNIEAVPPFTDGVTSLGYGAAGELSVGAPGQVLVRTPNGVPILGVEQLGAGQLVMATDINLLSDHTNGAYTAHDNATLVDNLCRYG